MDNSTLEKKELFCEVDAALSACTMKWVEVEEREEGCGGRRRIKQRNRIKNVRFFLSIYIFISK